MEDLGHWKTSATKSKNDIGFCYKITHRKTGRYYYGMKKLVVKGKKKEAWKTYCSSSKTLQAAIEKCGKDEFEFVILSFHPSKSSMAYEEAKLIVGVEAFRRLLLPLWLHL